jgi:hypothetical protein
MSSITATPQYVENIDRGHGECWVNPDNVKVSDDTYATVWAGQTDWLKLQDFDFSALPDDVEILGVELAIHCKGLHVKDDQVYLVHEGTIGGSNRAGCVEWKNNENIHILGSPSDTWGWNLTPYLIKSQWFGVNFCAEAYDSTGGTAFIDYITLTVYYENKTAILNICNDALAIIGEPAIVDIDGTDAKSKACKRNYGSIRKRLLGSHDWLTASYRAQLRPAYACPLFGWAYVYELPSNFLRMVEIHPLEAAYELGATNKLYMNEGKGYIKYIANIDDPAMFDINFETALVYRLALVFHACFVNKITAYQVLQKEAGAEINRAILLGTRSQKHIKGTFNWTTELRE